MGGHGVLPDTELHELLATSRFEQIEPKAVQAEVIDFPIAREAFRVPGVFIVEPAESVRDALKRHGARRVQLGEPVEIGQIICAFVTHIGKLLTTVSGYANPTSSAARNFIGAQVVADGVENYDTLPNGFSGDVWIFLVPLRHAVVFSEGDVLAQMRFMDSDTRLDKGMFEGAFNRHSLMHYNGTALNFNDPRVKFEQDGLVFTLDLSDDIVGYRSRSRGKPVVYCERNQSWEDFYEPISRPKDAVLYAIAGDHLLMRTRENICVPDNLAAEIEALDQRSGSFISHKAGFFAPGYGMGDGNGLPITLEVHGIQQNTAFRNGQRICRARFESMRSAPEHPYHGSYNTYRMLPKQFTTAVP
jgi:deoxycytidine triphosphate deaminase